MEWLTSVNPSPYYTGKNAYSPGSGFCVCEEEKELTRELMFIQYLDILKAVVFLFLFLATRIRLKYMQARNK